MSVEKSDNVGDFKLHDLRCFDTVVRTGSYAAAGQALNRTHPSVFAAVARLEAQLGLTLLDRSAYRATPTEAGRMFHGRATLMLKDLDDLGAYARQLGGGEETVLRVVLGDLCPRPLILKLLSGFFAGRTRTRLHLDYEAVGGPAERLHQGTADLVFHRAKASDLAVERIRMAGIRLIPCAAPGFLPFARGDEIAPEQLRAFTQCVIRDTARHAASENHLLVEGAHRCTVPDHAMKKEMILHRMAWGHLPEFMIADELAQGSLISLANRHLPGRVETLAAMRLRDRHHGPVAEALWTLLSDAFPDAPAPMAKRAKPR